MHKDESEVKLALSLPRSELLRKINNIKKKGILSENITLKSKGKGLIRERRQGSEALSMCLGCKGFYSRRRIGKHKKVCERSLGLNQGTLCASFLKESTGKEIDDFELKVLQKFRNDEVGHFCKTDSAIIKIGRKLWFHS